MNTTLNVSDHADSDLLTMWFDLPQGRVEVDLTPNQATELANKLLNVKGLARC